MKEKPSNICPRCKRRVWTTIKWLRKWVCWNCHIMFGRVNLGFKRTDTRRTIQWKDLGLHRVKVRSITFNGKVVEFFKIERVVDEFPDVKEEIVI